MPSVLRPVHTARRPHPANQAHAGVDTSKAALHLATAILNNQVEPQVPTSLQPPLSIVHQVPQSGCTSSITSTSSNGEPFGTILGTFEGVDVRSCLLPDNKKALDMDKASYQGFCTGVQWQCVELARRFLLQHYHVTFDCIPTAHDIFDSAVFRHASSRALVRTLRVPHGVATTPPAKGSLLLWKSVGRHTPTGHVAVVVDATDTHVDIIEQNFYHMKWPEGRRYSRRLPVLPSPDAYVLATQFDDEEYHGWVTVT